MSATSSATGPDLLSVVFLTYLISLLSHIQLLRPRAVPDPLPRIPLPKTPGGVRNRTLLPATVPPPHFPLCLPHHQLQGCEVALQTAPGQAPLPRPLAATYTP